MAIVKMKRLRLIGLRTDQEELLRRLQRLGCVEIDQPPEEPGDPAWAALSHPAPAALNEARDDSAVVQGALLALNRYTKRKGGLFHGRPEVSAWEFFDDGAYAAGLETARTIYHAERQINSLYAEQAKLRAQKLTLAPWLSLDVPLDAASTPEVLIQLGTIPARYSLDEVLAALRDASELAQLTPASSDSEAHYVLLVCHRSAEDAVGEVLKEYGFAPASLKGWTGTAAENDRRLEEELEHTAQAVEQEKQMIVSRADQYGALERCADRSAQEIRREEAKSHLLDTDCAFYLDGWVPAEEVETLAQTLAPFVCAWETADPTEDEYDQVPVKLKNNWFTRPLNMVTEMYSLPAYNGVDPNPLMAPFFVLFYGIMLADMGYGLLMIAASLFVTLKIKPKGTMGHMFRLAGMCGVTTFLMGALTGGFFGDFLPQLAKLINPNTTFTALPSLFTPLDNTIQILVGAMALGFVQIITGMAISFIRKLKAGQVMDAIWEELTWWVVFAGIGLFALGIGSVNGVPVVLAVGIVMIVVGSGWNAKGFGKVTAIFGSLYNHITGYFGDILSYSRLMALMLAGSVIAQVFNTLGAIPGNIVIFLLISLAGNTLNFVLNLLGCYVHDLRLQCLEFFGKFYEDGGRPFKPLEINTKYVDITENK